MTSQLSAAQIQERRNAARARWDKARAAATVAGGAAGGLAAASITGNLITLARERQIQQKNAALEPLRTAFRGHKTRQAIIDQKAKTLASGVRSDGKFLPTAARLYDLKARAGAAAAHALAQHQAAHSETYFDSTSGDTVQASDDIEGENKLIARAYALGSHEADRFKAVAADLRTKGKPGIKVKRAASIHTPNVESFSRKVRGKPQLILSGKTRAALNEIFEQDALERARKGSEFSILHDLGIKSIADLESHFLLIAPADRTAFAEFLKHEVSLPALRLGRPLRRTEVTNAPRVVPEQTVKIQGYPRAEARKKMRSELLRDIADRHRYKTALESARIKEEMTGSKAIAARAGRLLPFLRPRGRRGILGAGIGAGVLAGAFAAAKIEQALARPEGSKSTPYLAKSTPYLGQGSSPPDHRQLTKANLGDSEDSDPENGDFIPAPPPGADAQKPGQRLTTAHKLLAAAEGVEEDLAAGIGRAFTRWKDAVTPESVAAPEVQGGLFDQLDAPLLAGMAPLDRATSAGVTAPTRIQLPPGGGQEGGEPKPRLLHFGFNTRSTDVEQYAKRYRYDRVREITDAQRKNIRQIIATATNTADPPAVIARKIRDIVGLTAGQARIVQNYRMQLETNDPRSLTYSLRDKRFDRTVKKALEEKKPLGAEQVDKLVDAYQRRFIAHRAMTIARTESLRAANNGHVQAVQYWLDDHPEYTVAKTWIATEDDRTRPDHRALHRQTVIGMKTPFTCESGEQILWPHDPKAAAKEVINCRCTTMLALIPRSAAMKNGPGAYGTPTPNFWSQPRKPFDISSPDDLFGAPELEPA